MFKNTYMMRFNHDHFESIKAITDTFGIEIRYCFTNYQGITEIKFKAKEKEIDALKVKLNKYGMTVS